jgi:transcription-repair coupling factor (superfamily II helicase)
VQKKAGVWKVRPDNKLVVRGEWETPNQRLNAAERILQELAFLARKSA